jgi:hypothetical protein
MRPCLYNQILLRLAHDWRNRPEHNSPRHFFFRFIRLGKNQAVPIKPVLAFFFKDPAVTPLLGL